MDVKNIIGQRIIEARKFKGLSRIELAEQSGLGKTRIGNWETGFRTPKLEEAKILEKILEVPAPYLLCLSDQKDFPDNFGANIDKFKAIPIFTESNLIDIDNIVQLEIYKTEHSLPLLYTNEKLIEQGAFAFQLFDDSMAPEYRKSDIIAFNPNQKIRHNDYVIVKVLGTNEIMFRKIYVDSSDIHNQFIKLVPNNSSWMTQTITDKSSILIFGVMSSIQRIFT